MNNSARSLLKPFNYQGVRLLDSRWQRQVSEARDYFAAVPNDNILRGFRLQAGMAAPGQDMGGWCARDSGMVFGQWLSGMSRLSKALGDDELRDKAVYLMHEWGKTLHRLQFDHYVYDKYVCGLVDMYEYAAQSEALELLEQCTKWAEANLSRRRLPASDEDSQGGYFTGDSEWYTLAENLYRAYAITQEERYRRFADVWLYPHYWDMFSAGREPAPYGFHGYSHVNALSSAAQVYGATGDTGYLQATIGAYDYFQTTQCYATGGYGPGEKLMRPDGSLGESLVTEPNDRFLRYHVGRSFEAPCGSWAVFKLGRYLMSYTGEARFGHWVEQVLYNGIGAALPMASKGRTFYYADYRLIGGTKFYHRDPWPCCSGTYLQDVADYANIIFFHAPDGLSISQYLPSKATWSQSGVPVTLKVETMYPESEEVTASLSLPSPSEFALHWRVPQWCAHMAIAVNGEPFDAANVPGTWATVQRRWHNGDRIAIRLPHEPRLTPIDAHHPDRVAVASGPVVLVRVEDPLRLSSHEPAALMEPTASPLLFSAAPQATRGRWLPYYSVDQGVPYRMYFDVERG